MRVWLVTCIVLFILVQLYQWVKGFILPLPIYVLAAAFLSIASNYDKGMDSLFNSSKPGQETLSQTATLVDSIPTLEGDNKTLPRLESQETFNEE